MSKKMIGSSVRYVRSGQFGGIYSHRRVSHLAGLHSNRVATAILHQKRSYASGNDDEKPSCCKEIDQTKGRQVEDGPICSPWGDPLNSDPYRIKVHEVVVPPIIPTGVKDSPENENARKLFDSPEINAKGVKDLFHNSAIAHPDYWKEKPQQKQLEVVTDVMPRLSYHGRTKYKFAFHEPWKPLDRLSLLAQAEKEELDQADELNAVKKCTKT